MLTVENLQEILEKESISEFINVEDFSPIDGDDGIYYCKNGYRGYGFVLNPSPYSGVNEHNSILKLLGQKFPPETAIQIVSGPSRNILPIINFYESAHKRFDNVKRPEALQNLIQSRIEWAKNGIYNGLSNQIEFFPITWSTVITVLIPEYNKKGDFIPDKDILNAKKRTEVAIRSLNPSTLSPEILMSFISEKLEPFKKEWDGFWDPTISISEQVISPTTFMDSDDFGNIKIIHKDDETTARYVKVLTPKKFPPRLTINMAQNLFLENFGDDQGLVPIEPYIKENFFVCMNISIEDIESAKENLLMKSRANRQQRNMLGEYARYFPKVDVIGQEADELITMISEQNESVFKMQYSIIVQSKTKKDLESQTEAIIGKFSTVNFELQEETEIALPIMLYSLPFQYDTRYKQWSKRFKTTLKGNNCAVAPLLNEPKGSFTEPALMHFGRGGQIQFFDNFNPAVGNNNICIAAGSRAGKTYGILEYVSQQLAMGRFVRVVEDGENFGPLCKEIGGKQIKFVDDCLNFFTHIKTAEGNSKIIHDDAMTGVIPLIGLMIGRKLISENDEEYDSNDKSDNAVISSYIEKAVQKAFYEGGHDIGMKEVHKELKNIFEALLKDDYRDERLYNTIVSLEPYALETGKFYKFYNGENTVKFAGIRLVAFELSKVKNIDQGLMIICLMTVVYNISNEFFGEDLLDILKSLILDEAWMYAKNPLLAAFLIRVFRTIGKYNGAGIIVSQDIELYFANADMKALFYNSTYKWFLKQSAAQIDEMVKDNRIDSSPFFIDKLKSLESYPGVFSEVMIMVDESWYISRIITDRFAFYLYSTRDKTPQVSKLAKEMNIQHNEAAWIFGHKDTFNCSLEESILSWKKQKGLIKEDEYKELEAYEKQRKSLELDNLIKENTEYKENFLLEKFKIIRNWVSKKIKKHNN